MVELSIGGIKRFTAKFSDGKISIPGAKQVFRGEARDVIVRSGECGNGEALLRPVILGGHLVESLGVEPTEVVANDFNYLALLESPQALRKLAPDMAAIARLDRPGLIVTAAGDGHFDFISRYFAPAKGIPEDPVTGAAHCMLTPYWANRLGKTTFRAFQSSPRGGEVICRLKGDRVELEGCCVFYLEGQVEI